MLLSIFNESGRADKSGICAAEKNFDLLIIHFEFVC